MSRLFQHVIYSKHLLLASAAVATVLTCPLSPSYASCGTASANTKGGNDYILAGSEEAATCILDNHDTFSVTSSGSITLEDTVVLTIGTDISITNAGNIAAQSDQFAVSVRNDEVRAVLTSLTNNGGTISSEGSAAVHTYNGTITTLDNTNGTISSGTSAGVSVESLSGEIDDEANGSITTVINAYGVISTDTGTAFGNQGTITLFNNDHGTIKGTGAGSYAFANDGIITKMTNNGGLILSTGEGNYAFANSRIMAFDNTNGTVQATSGHGVAMFLLTGFTDNILKNTNGLITTAGNTGQAIYINQDIGRLTIHGGTISNTGNSNNATAIAVSHIQSDIMHLDNVQLISDGDTAGSGHGVALNSSNDLDLTLDNSTVRGSIIINASHLIINNSSIIGNLRLGGDGTNRVLFNNSSLTGNIESSGNLEFKTSFTTAGTISTTTDLNIVVDEGSTLTLNHEMTLGLDPGIGDITVSQGGTLVLNEGNITAYGDFINRGTTRIGSDRTLLVGSVHDSKVSGTIQYVAANDSGTLTTGHIDTGETSANLSGQLIDVRYTGTGLLDTTQRALIAIGTGTATTPADMVTDNSFLYDFSAVAEGRRIYLIPSIVGLSHSATPSEAARVLVENLADSTNPTMIQIQTNLASATNESEYRQVTDSIQPSANHSGTITASNVTSSIFNVITHQLAQPEIVNTTTGVSTGDAPKGLHVWGEGFGSHANQGERAGIAGYDSDTFGAAIGVDTRNLDETIISGIALAYGNTQVNASNANHTDTDINTYQATLYRNHHFDKNVLLTGMFTFGENFNQETRYNVGGISGLTASGEYNSWQAGTRWELGRRFYCQSSSMFLTPSLRADYLHYHAQSYTETGAGGANLQVDSKNVDNLNMGIGLQGEWVFKNSNGSFVAPNIHGRYSYQVLNSDQIDANSRFTAGGGSFTTQELDPANSTFELGAGVRFYQFDNWEFTGSYDYTFKQDYHANSGMIKAEYRF